MPRERLNKVEVNHRDPKEGKDDLGRLERDGSNPGGTRKLYGKGKDILM